MTAATLAPEDLAIQETLAAKIRRIASTAYLAMAKAAPDAREMEALTLCHHLRADRVPEAAYAHRQLVRVVCENLRTCGVTLPRHGELVRLLWEYCEQGGLTYRDGRWLTFEQMYEQATGRSFQGWDAPPPGEGQTPPPARPA